MGQVLHRSATTTEAVRRAIQHSQSREPEGTGQVLRHQPQDVAKWKRRTSVTDLPTGPKEPRSTVLSVEDEAIIVAFRRHTLLPPDDCLYALQATIPHLTRSSLYRCLQRHGIGRLPQVDGDKPAKKAFKAYPIGFFHIDIAEVQTAEGKLYLFVAMVMSEGKSGARVTTSVPIAAETHRSLLRNPARRWGPSIRPSHDRGLGRGIKPSARSQDQNEPVGNEAPAMPM
jgi:hypothetical protein